MPDKNEAEEIKKRRQSKKDERRLKREKQKKIESRERRYKERQKKKAEAEKRKAEAEEKERQIQGAKIYRRRSERRQQHGNQRRSSVKQERGNQRRSSVKQKLPLFIDEKVRLETLCPDHIVMVAIEDRIHPCIVQSVDTVTNSVQVKFEDGEEETVDAQHLREPEVNIRRRLEFSLRKTKRLKKQDKQRRISLVSSPSALDYSVGSGSNLISKNINGVLDDVDKSEDDTPNMNTALDGIKTRNGGIFFPRWIGDKYQRDVIPINSNVNLHRRSTVSSVVYEIEVDGKEEIHFHIDLSESTNVRLIDDPFSLKKTVIAKAGTWKEVCFLTVIDSEKPWELHSTYRWNVKNYIYDPGFGCCGGTRLLDSDEDYDSEDTESPSKKGEDSGCVIA